MKLVKIKQQHSNDIYITVSCSLCGATYDTWGYLDNYYMNTVLPNAICPNCNKNAYGDTPQDLINRGDMVYWL